MTALVINSNDLGTPYQCPLCWRLFYFEGDYVKHKCIASKLKFDNKGKKK